jgi:hypothetical protein
VLLYINGLEIRSESLSLRYIRLIGILKHWYLMAHVIGMSLKALLLIKWSLSIIHI